MKRLLTIFAFLLSIAFINSQHLSTKGTKQFSSIIFQESDEAKENSLGKVSTGETVLDMSLHSKKELIGLRFQDINIPKNVEIVHAYLQFTSAEPTTEKSSFTIKAHLVENSKTFSAIQPISSRNTTRNKVHWTPKSWKEIWDQNNQQQTPNLAHLVQEIVDQKNWEEGNAISFIIDGKGKRVAESFNSEISLACQLHIEYR